MLDKLLTSIRESEDYRDAMAAFQTDTPLTAENVEKLLNLYKKYMNDRDPENPEYPRIYLAIDLLPGRTASSPDFGLLGLKGKTLNALFQARDICCNKVEITAETIAEFLQVVRDEDVELPIRIIYARGLLDAAATSHDCASMVDEISELANFFINCDQDAMDHYVTLVREVRGRCR